MGYDRNAFLMYLAGFTSEFPVLVSKFEKMYQQNKSKFFTLACRNPRYSDNFLNDKNLIQDVAVKRIFGVYLASDEDEQIRNSVCEALQAFEPRFEKYQRELKSMQTDRATNIFSKIQESREYADSVSKRNFVLYAAHYLTGEEEYSIEFDIIQRDGFDHGRLRKIIDRIEVFEQIEIDPGDWKIIKKIISDNEIQELLKIPEKVLSQGGRVGDSMNNQLYLEWVKDLESREREDGWTEMILLTNYLAGLFEYHGLSITKIFQNTRISKAERDMILKLCAHGTQQMKIVAENQKKTDFSLYCQSQVGISDYYIRFLFYLLIKNFLEIKQFYNENNNETFFSQVSVYREENEKLTKELQEVKHGIKLEREQSELLRRQIVEKTQHLSKDEKELLKPYQEEISVLRKQITSLETTLEAEREKASELHALREFAFDVKSEFIPTSSQIDLSDLIKQKRLVVIGGHIEWRNKLKAKYPNIIVVNGHNSGSDFSMLINADMVLLNVSNMSHSVYYKAIDILRGNKVKFDYLGRTINQELYEQEIISILEKHGF